MLAGSHWRQSKDTHIGLTGNNTTPPPPQKKRRFFCILHFSIARVTIATKTVRHHRLRPLLVRLSRQQMVQLQSAGGLRRNKRTFGIYAACERVRKSKTSEENRLPGGRKAEGGEGVMKEGRRRRRRWEKRGGRRRMKERRGRRDRWGFVCIHRITLGLQCWDKSHADTFLEGFFSFLDSKL